ncbi:endo-1,4-beta-xylanase (plasmid) [Clostridium estertheticum]|uniref:endo-1,4-beta-xylanase n=1 Tax=Clostridium estertheticum TaxID=238834 RepID=UPI00209A864C|nr:endo-1,4-beta-xylanase [Clostridium estertheticum]WAG58320.1 endo-1,4-beta-xylanase [Clostridium estertheticum]
MKKLLKHLRMVILVIAIAISSFGVSQAKAATTNQTLLNTYGGNFGRVGSCVTLAQLQDPATLSVIKQRYNSITLENEMKPDALLGLSPTLITVSQAKALGYYIPSNYTETTVPKIDFTNVDKVLQICYKNGLGVRGHTLIWHSQTPPWLFNTRYSSSGSYVSSTVMDARMEFYIKTVMSHVHSSNYGSVVYAWDVVNEYLHSLPTPALPASGWFKIYGNITTSPQYVKNAFRYAYETTSHFGLTNKVSLFYNDYNEYMESSNIIKMINYINSGTRYCNGIGCQSHLSTSFPSVDYYKSALQAFMNAGLEIQITELDAGAPTETEQAAYSYNIMKAICDVKKSGANITGITWWGLSDNVSWRKKNNDNPLLFSTLYVPKASYYRTLDAYTNVFN